MPDPSHRPYDPMNIIRPSLMPRLWWLNPWATARFLHSAATALKDYADQADRCIEMQIRIIEDKNREVDRLKAEVKYWRIEAETDNARWLRTLEENEGLRQKGGQP